MDDKLLGYLRACRIGSDGEARAIRRRARVPLRLLAVEVGVDASTLKRWEDGTSTPRDIDAAVRWEAAIAGIAQQLDADDDTHGAA